MAIFNHVKTSHKHHVEFRQRMEYLLQLTLPNPLGSLFRALEGWKEKERFTTDELGSTQMNVGFHPCPSVFICGLFYFSDHTLRPSPLGLAAS